MIRTRFAPSPTGYLHIGGARTALYCYLYARKMGGKFILRVEDTDLERSTPESVQAILDGMAWLNLEYDEGPYFQTKRFDRYKDVIEELLKAGKAYRCYCSKERLEKLREGQMQAKQKPRYDGHCRDRDDAGEGPFVVRFKNPQEGAVSFKDLVRGDITVSNQELDDLIIARSDGTPTYNFTVVVDDWDMNITHVIRGDDHINNTPRQINILQALGAELPQYAHIPMILGGDGKRLSKRHGAVSVLQYREDGFLPEALVNYLVRLGWSHGDQEIFSKEELIELFDIHDVNRAAAAFNEEKLLWLNQHYMKATDVELIAEGLAWHLSEIGVHLGLDPEPPLVEVVHAQVDRVKTLREMAERSTYFYAPVTVSDEELANIPDESRPAILEVGKRLRALSDWNKEAIHQVIKDVAKDLDLKMGKVAQPLRILLTGGTVSPSIDETIRLIGREQAVDRLNNGLNLNKSEKGATAG